MKKSLAASLTSILALAIAPAAFAAEGHLNLDPVKNLSTDIISILNTIVVPLVFAVAFVVFLFGVYRYFIAGGADEEKQSEGRKFVLWSVIGFAIMISIWGLVNLLVATFGFGSATRPCLPTFTGPCIEGSASTNHPAPTGTLDTDTTFY